MNSKKRSKAWSASPVDDLHEFMQVAASQIGSKLDAEEAAGTPLPDPKKATRSKTPWLVKERDLRRYLGRALNACASGRVIFYCHRYKDRRRMLSLSSFPDPEDALGAARVALAKGEYREVVLADLPKKKR